MTRGTKAGGFGALCRQVLTACESDCAVTAVDTCSYPVCISSTAPSVRG